VPVFAAISLMATRGETTPLSMTMMAARSTPAVTHCVNNLAMNKPFRGLNNVIYNVPANFLGAGAAYSRLFCSTPVLWP
jgi:poly(3-hydroxybutyrate) depolymerase